jgi:hypothetical protein
LTKLIKSLPGCEGDTVNTETLSILAILWCNGGDVDKAENFYKLIQPPGQNSTSFAANDKEFPSLFKNLVRIATIW